jgi:hypothetical protein
MKWLDRIGRFFGSDFWFLVGLLADLPELIWLWLTDRKEYQEMFAAIMSDLRDYFSDFD